MEPTQREKEVTKFSILERILRVEEELKSLRELQEKQFEAILREMNTRFEAMNTRFETLEKRLNFMQWFIVAGFSILSLLISLFKLF